MDFDKVDPETASDDVKFFLCLLAASGWSERDNGWSVKVGRKAREVAGRLFPKATFEDPFMVVTGTEAESFMSLYRRSVLTPGSAVQAARDAVTAPVREGRLITLDVKKVTVLLHRGTDRISLTLNAVSPFPEMGYEAGVNIEARHGYGVEWCRTVLGVEPDEVIDTRAMIRGRHTGEE